jgi:hypothetical protein
MLITLALECLVKKLFWRENMNFHLSASITKKLQQQEQPLTSRVSFKYTFDQVIVIIESNKESFIISLMLSCFYHILKEREIHVDESRLAYYAETVTLLL